MPIAADKDSIAQAASATVVGSNSVLSGGKGAPGGYWSEDLRLKIHHGDASGVVIAEIPSESDSQTLIQETLNRYLGHRGFSFR